MKLVMKPNENIRFLENQKGSVAFECDGLAFVLFESGSGNRCPVVVSGHGETAFASLEAGLKMRNRDAVSEGKFKVIATPDFVAKFVAWTNSRKFDLSNSVVRNGSFEVVYDFDAGKLRVSKETAVSLAKKVKVLIVDDSITIRNILSQIFSADPSLEVVGAIEHPSQVEEAIVRLKPDVMTLDIHMPAMSGLDLLREILPKYKIPTIMISSISKEEGPEVLEALAIGAVDYIQKPSFSNLNHVANEMRESVRAAAGAKVRNIQFRKSANAGNFSRKDYLIAIGSSTGGTEALKVLFECLPSAIPPILVVQHIPAVFSKALADRLNELSPFEIKEAADGDIIKENRVLIAPGGKQMAAVEIGGQLKVRITDDEPVNRHKPSVDYLFESVAQLRNQEVHAVILTGMGADGAKGMKKLKDLGARTIAQDQETCVVYGMPREAVLMGGAEFESPLHKIGEKLVNLSAEKKTRLAG